MKVLGFLMDDQKTERRRKSNQQIIERMRQGESLNRFDAQESWFPPRPVIEKDRKALSELYGTKKLRVKNKKEKKRHLATISHLNGTHN